MNTTEHEPMHEWFQLSYSNYLVLRRSAIQSMPDEWQARLRTCLEELRESFGYIEDESGITGFRVTAMCHRRAVTDPYSRYDRGRRRLISAKGSVRP